MRAAIITIIIAFLLIIPMQMLLPFPYGLGVALFLIILGIAAIIVARKNHKRREKFAEEHLRYHDENQETTKNEDKSWNGI